MCCLIILPAIEPPPGLTAIRRCFASPVENCDALLSYWVSCCVPRAPVPALWEFKRLSLRCTLALRATKQSFEAHSLKGDRKGEVPSLVLIVCT